jgi:hypothetical protein
MSTKRTDAEQKASVTQDELDKAVLEAREQGKIAARIEVGGVDRSQYAGWPLLHGLFKYLSTNNRASQAGEKAITVSSLRQQ